MTLYLLTLYFSTTCISTSYDFGVISCLISWQLWWDKRLFLLFNSATTFCFAVASAPLNQTAALSEFFLCAVIGIFFALNEDFEKEIVG